MNAGPNNEDEEMSSYKAGSEDEEMSSDNSDPNNAGPAEDEEQSTNEINFGGPERRDNVLEDPHMRVWNDIPAEPNDDVEELLEDVRAYLAKANHPRKEDASAVIVGVMNKALDQHY